MSLVPLKIVTDYLLHEDSLMLFSVVSKVSILVTNLEVLHRTQVVSNEVVNEVVIDEVNEVVIDEVNEVVVDEVNEVVIDEVMTVVIDECE
ncbi:hypothetical protein Tco_0817927 [Tanacetum coccineum]